MPQKRMEYFKQLFNHLTWIEHLFLSGIWDSRKVGSLWGMMRGVGGARKSIHQREFRKRFRRKRPTLFKSAQWHFHLNNAPVHNSILVTDYLTTMANKTVPHPSYSQDLAPYDFWLFPKHRDCRYEIIEERKEAVTKVIDTLTQEDFHDAIQNFLERYNKCIAAGGDYFEGDLSFVGVLSTKVPYEKSLETYVLNLGCWT